MQTAGVKICEDLNKRLSTSGGLRPSDPLTGALLLYVPSLDFMERTDSYFAKFGRWRLESQNYCLLRLLRLQTFFRMKTYSSEKLHVPIA